MRQRLRTAARHYASERRLTTTRVSTIKGQGPSSVPDRLRSAWWSVLQCGVAAGLAWQLAATVLGHPAPLFACVAAVVCLGIRPAQHLRRVAELAVGVSMGVAVGELLARWIGAGAWQSALVVPSRCSRPWWCRTVRC